MGTGLPPADDPLVEQLLKLGQRPDGALGDIGAPAGDVTAGVAGDVLTEQGVDRGEGALDDRLVPRRRLHPISTIGTDVCG